MKRLLLAHLAILVVACAVFQALPEVSAQADQEQLWRSRNLGKALFETPTSVAQAPLELKKAADLAPGSFADRANYGMALLRAGQTEAGVVELLKAQKQDPQSPHTWFNLGIAYKRLGRLPDAIRQFERMVELVPDEPVSHYNLGYLYRQAERVPEAVKQFEIAARLNPNLVAPRFAIFDYYRLNGGEQQAAAALATLLEVRKRLETAGGTEDMEWSFYAELVDPVRPAGLARKQEPVQEPRFERRKLAGSADPASAGMLALDSDGDRRPDLLVWSKSGVRLFRRGRDPMAESGLGDLKEVVSVAAGDFDNDGLADLCILTAQAAMLYHNARGRFEKNPVVLPSGPFVRAVWLDFDHDYDLDLFLFGPKPALFRNTGTGFEDYTGHFPFAAGAIEDAMAFRSIPDSKGIDVAVSYAGGKRILYRDGLRGDFVAAALEAMPARSATEADFDGDGRADRFEVAADGGIFLLLNRSTKSHWLGVSLAGVKNLKLAWWSEVEVRAGDLYLKKVYEGVPVVFDLGERRMVDAVRITWPNGLIQNETNVAGDRMLVVKEAPRLAGSCPMVFTWNGKRFEFVTDVLGVAPLGASAGQDRYFPVDHDEYVRIKGESLSPVRGHFEVRIAEELQEVAYIDQVRLFALDRAADIEVFTNDKFKSPPFPDFRLFGAQRRVLPQSARDHRGRDVLPALLCSDAVYAGGFQHDSAGVAEMHSHTFDFGPRAAVDNRAVLILEGWVDWADGSTFQAASQAGRGLTFPYLQVKDAEGKWKTVVEDVGIPAGKPKTIAVDLTGLFLSASREIRIVTNLCLYWDSVFLSENSASPRVRLTALDARVADLRLRGFSRPVIDPKREQPERFDYARWIPSANWNQTPGLYTRYGDVQELTQSADDRLVIMGSGDELRLLFPADALPSLAPGERRDFLLLVDGWAKDADANTAFSQSVEPLPFHAMSRYPYPASERFPDDAVHKNYRAVYNTRPAIRFLSALQ